MSEIAAPAWLAELRDDGLAVEFFERAARGLARAGVLTDLDVEALAATSECYSLYRRCCRSMPKRITTPTKGKNPLVYAVRRQAYRDLHMGLAQFGLNPVARSKVIAGGEVPLPPSVAEGETARDRGSSWLDRYGGAAPA